MMNVRPFYDAASNTFTYLVDDGHGSCAVVDPVLGYDAKSGRTESTPVEPIVQIIREERLQLVWLLETHAHADHLSSAPYLQRQFGGTIAIGDHITEVQRVFRDVFNVQDLPVDGSQFDRLLTDGERLMIGHLQVEVMHVPGHTPADVAYRIQGEYDEPDAVFVGDTLFMPAAGTARCDFPGGDARVLFRSVRRLLALPPQTRIFVCHDYPPAGEPPRCVASVADHRVANIHVADGTPEDEFVRKRQERDASLSLPALMLPAVQVNIRAGNFPAPEHNGVAYLKIPVNRL